MLEEVLDYSEYKEMIDKSVDFTYVNEDSNLLYKLDKNCLISMNMKDSINKDSTKIDVSQIDWLNSLNQEIKKSELPYGIAYYDKIPVSVIYDKINKGYKSFNNLYGEDDNLIFGNLKKSYYSNKELLDNDIYNVGFRFNNIIYKNKNVKLVNLDSFNIKRDANYREVYERYLEDLKQLFFTKLLMSHERDEAIEIYREYASMFCDYTDDMSVDYPLYVIKEMQRKLTIK